MSFIVTDQLLSLRNSVSSTLHGKPSDSGRLLVVAAAGLASLFFDVSQLIFVFVGFVAYALLQPTPVKTKGAPFRANKDKEMSMAYCNKENMSQRHTAKRVAVQRAESTTQHQAQRNLGIPHKVQQDFSKLELVPVTAPTFSCDDWDVQVNELVALISPKPEGQEIMNKLIQVVKRSIQRVLPNAEVVGLAFSDIACGKAYGVAVPEVDIIVNLNPAALAQQLHSRLQNGGNNLHDVDPRKVQKSAIRVCTDKLINSGFKFRRSAFRVEEPKVTLVAPVELGICKENIPLDFSINTVTPFYSNALLKECGHMDARAKELILVVRRWTKDRGICHAAKGNLSPYVWSLLSIYFLQVGVEEGPLLPPLAHFKQSSRLMRKQPSTETSALVKTVDSQNSCRACQRTVGTLFKDFISFYRSEFKWQSECVSLAKSQRGNSAASFPLHAIHSEDGQTMVTGPSIENPFNPDENLASSMTSTGLSRLHNELARAHDLMARGASLTELLEPWIPLSEATEDGTVQSFNSGRH